MNYQARAVRLSLIIHAVICIAVVGIGSFVVPVKSLLVIDFSIDDQLPAPRDAVQNALPAQERKQAVRPAAEKAEPAKAEPVKSRAVTPQQVSEAQVPVAAPPQMQAPGSERESPPRNAAPAEKVVPGEGKPGPPHTADAKSRYMQENYSYIRDLIQKKVVYPRMARKMGWEGKVVISFIIMDNGQVSNIKIVQSSGAELLDKTTIETVKGVSPLPRPPAEAELTVPVTYKLN